MFTFTAGIMRMGGHTKVAEMLYDVQPLPSSDFPLDVFFSPEPPSQQHKQTVDGEQVDDGRVVAGKLILPVDESPPDKC